MENGRQHVVFVVPYRFITVDLRIVENITDLLGNFASCVSYVKHLVSYFFID